MDFLFPGRALRVTGSVYADISLMQKDGKTMVHIINSAGPHSDYNVRGFTEIPKIGPLKVELRRKTAPERVALQPGDAALDFTFADGLLMGFTQLFSGLLTIAVPEIEIYSIVVVE